MQSECLAHCTVDKRAAAYSVDLGYNTKVAHNTTIAFMQAKIPS